MSRVHPIFLLVFALLSQCAFAQQTATTVQRDSQAVAALQRALAALGGTSKPMPSSIVASGTYALFLADSTVSYPVRVKVLGLDQFRWEVDTPDQGTVATVVFGTVGWRQYSQHTEAMTASEIPGNTFDNFPVLALARWIGSSTDGLTMVGSETINGNSVYHISITPTLSGNTDPNREKMYESTHRREIYLDQQSFLPIRIRYYKHPTDWRVAIPIDVEYSKYQTASGIEFPMVMTSYAGDQPLNQIQYQSLLLNVSVAASDFVESLP